MKKPMAIMAGIAFLLFGTVILFRGGLEIYLKNLLSNLPEPENPVTALVIPPQDWTTSIETIGFVEPNQGVTLTAAASGHIDNLAFNSGDRVKKDQLLLSLDTKVEKANIDSALARLPAVEAKFKRYQNLYKSNAISKDQVDDAQANYQALKSDIESLKQVIRRREVRAPFAGIIGIRNKVLGEYVQPGTPIVRLEDSSMMRLRFTVPQTDLARLKIGQTVDIKIDAYPEKSFSGSVNAIEPAVNAQSGLVNVEANIPNTDGLLRSGMFARASVRLNTKTNQVVIPETAITFTLYGESVFVITPQKEKVMVDDQETEVEVLRVKQTIVKVGARQGNNAHVVSGLAVNDRIVLTGQVKLKNNSKVRIVQDDSLALPAEPPML